MFTDRLTEITSAEWEYRPINVLKSTLKMLRLTLSKSSGISEKRLLEKELGSLCKAYKGYYIHLLSDLTPALGGIICSLKEITAENIISCVSRVGAVKSLTSMDIDTMIWQAKFCLIKTAVLEGYESGSAEKLARLTELDGDELCAALNPLDLLYNEDTLYSSLTADTRALYRKMTSEISIATGIEEARLSREYLSRASINVDISDKENYVRTSLTSYATGTDDAVPFTQPEQRHIGEIIMKDYRRVFPFVNLRKYLICLFSSALLLSVFISLVTSIWAIFFVFLPAVAIIKPIIDYFVTKAVRSISVVPSIELKGSVPDTAKTLTVISTLLASEKDAEIGFQKLYSAKLRNQSGNIKYALLCDLKASDSEINDDDEKVINAAKKVFEGKSDFIVFIRKRKYSETQGKWQGHERKRGAIIALLSYLRPGSNPSLEKEMPFSHIFGDRKSLKGMKYILALDFDTKPLMNSVSELVGIALHPLHRNKGIIAPRITTTLSSYLKSGFSRAMSANGGCAGASTYDSFTGEMYQDCFGEGIFTGKGLIDIDIFLARCVETENKRRFPDEIILSHDILEGGCTGVVFAGGVEFSDGFPDNSNAFFKRQHRWLRGDLQNTRYIFDTKFSPLTRWKLADNVRRALTPILIFLCLFTAAFTGSELLGIISLISIIMPFLMGFIPSVIRGRRFANYRKFYSPIISQTKQLMRQCLVEIMLSPKNALVSFDALVRTLWRTLVTKKHLLDWTTSAAFEGASFGFKHLIGAEILSLILLISGIFSGNITVMILSILFSSALPVMMYADKVKGEVKPKLTSDMKIDLTNNARKMWQFYADYVTKKINYLPPDNVQHSPVYRLCPRTSPTNIGMYLLSAVSARLLGFIDKDELESRVDDTIATIERLEKWHGNLMNWYDIETLAVVSSFVSSVDSGNFVCCLVALKEALKAEGCSPMLIQRVERLADETDLTPFYNKSRRLFSIGYDISQNELSHHNYDLVMSEARMLSYYAIATGQADKSHWRSLGRTMGKDGRYAGPLAWTGTMFEYFMPELLLKSKEGSMEYEAIRFSLHCQQKRGRETGLPFGISESGYYAFDEELNYQYKAHGVQAVGLKAGLNNERVISPYSSFLSLAHDPITSYNNLVRIEKLGACHPKYSFYEAVDFTKKRVGTGHAVIKSHMAHHVGMSMVGILNALKDGKMQMLFLSDERMKRASELLEEKIIAGETVLGAPERQKEEEYRINAREYSEFSLEKIETNPISNGVLTVINTDIGISESFYEHKSMVWRTKNLMKPRGTLFAFVEGEHYMPFFWHPTLPDEICEAEQSVLFMQNSSEYYRNYRNLKMGMQVFLHPVYAAEFRKFAIENTSSIKRQITLASYLEPALLRFRDIEAHPAFMDLFLKIKYNEDEKLFIASRKERHGNNKTVMAVGFVGEEDLTYSLDREDVISRGGGIFSSLLKAGIRENRAVSVPSPCIFIKADLTLDANGKKEATLFTCYGKSEEEVIGIANEIRSKKEHLPTEEISSPLVQDTIYGRLCSRILPHILYTPCINKNAVMNNCHDTSALWRFGISGDRPIVLFEFMGKASGVDGIIEMKKALSLCQIEFDLVILYENNIQKKLIEQLRNEINTEVFMISKTGLDETLLNIIRASAVSSLSSDRLIFENKKKSQPQFLPLLKSQKPETEEIRENRFENEKYIIEKTNELPWCNVLASTEFGTLVSDRSLGFSWALNSRENKLTPWYNDLRMDNNGEMLVMKMNNNLYDLIDGGLAEFTPNRADYHSVVKGIHAKTSVRVFSKGMGKEITLNIENKSKKSRTVKIAYYTEPTLGVNRDKARLLKPSVSQNTLVIKTTSNGNLSGAMTITSNLTCTFITEPVLFWSGEWMGSIEPCGDIIGVAVVSLELPPKQSERIKFTLAFTKNIENPLSMERALKSCTFAPIITAPDINSGSDELDLLYKYWLPWQSIGCRMWARTGFYQNSGAYGFRDQLQDSLSVISLKPELTKRQLARACGVQFLEGDVLHWWHDLLGIRKGVRTRYSDDLLWLPYVLADYTVATGDAEFLQTEIYYASGELLKENEHENYIEIAFSDIKESVYNHAKKSLEKAYKKGRNELLLIGSGDWCDGYNNVGLNGKGESVWLSMFYAMTAKKFAAVANSCGDFNYAEKLEARAEELKNAVDKNAWDGDYYLRAFYDSGEKMGSRENDLCKIDLLPQAFSVFADMPNEKRKLMAVTRAGEQLIDYHYRLVKLFTPAFKYGKTWQKPGYVMSYPEGVRENGGQYTHAAVWLALAYHELGLEDMAERLAMLIAPFGRSNEYKTEPYYMSADIYTNPEAYGRGGWSIYTGSAGWYFTLLQKLYG